MRKQKWKVILALFALMIGFLGESKAVYARQMDTFTTYTYNENGDAVNSPAAYEFVREYAGNDMRVGELSSPSDIFVDRQQNIYIVDTGNNRIVILNPDFTLKNNFEKFINPDPAYAETDYMDSFGNPSAVYVTEEGHMYVADTDRDRIIEFDQEFQFVREVRCPDSEILGENYSFKPVSLVVDSSGRMYVMIKNENQGIVELSAEGEFIGYFGAQAVQQTIFDWFRTLFMTKEQKSRIAKVIPRTYNSMAIDNRDFIWLTSNSLTQYQRQSYMTSGSSTDAPIKRLNPSGNDVLVRNGTYAPGGDLMEVSSLVDVAVKDNGVYSLLDNNRNRIFTYDASGNLLYAFGGVGSQDGCMTLASAMAYFGDDLLVLDAEDKVLVRYGITEYGKNLENALTADDEKDFEASMEYWSGVLASNQNLELAYRAMGNNYLRNGYYEEAMDCYRNAGDKDGYSKAYQYVRTEYVKGHFILVVGVFLLVLICYILFKKWVNKENKKLYSYEDKHTLKDELLYAYRAIYHPFDGFWEIKKQRRGSIRSATVILLLVVLTFCYKAVGTAFLFREVDVEYVSILQEVLNILLPLLLWCVASWGLTTLFEGKGSMKDIYIMTCYAMFPLIFTNILTTVMSNGMVLEEKEFISFVANVGYVWMVLLIFAGAMVIHEYLFNKNVLMIASSLVGMGVMLFLAMLFVTIGQKMIDFFIGIYEEVAFRL